MHHTKYIASLNRHTRKKLTAENTVPYTVSGYHLWDRILEKFWPSNKQKYKKKMSNGREFYSDPADVQDEHQFFYTGHGIFESFT